MENENYINSSDNEKQNRNLKINEALILSFKNYFNFKGRSSRYEFDRCAIALGLFLWLLFFAFIVESIFCVYTEAYTLYMFFSGFLIFGVIILIIPTLSLLTRRLHDSGKSGLWLLILLVPCPVMFLIVFMQFTKESAPENKWGKP